MTEFLYRLPIAEKIQLNRNGGFKIMLRADAAAFVDIPEDETGALIIFSEEWLMGRDADGMIMSGDDAGVLEAAFAENYCDDSWGDIDPAAAEQIIVKMTKQARRKHLRVVE